MKKNLISIIILALLVVNMVISAITMFSVTSTNKKTAAVVTKIAEMVDLELASAKEAEGADEEVSLTDTISVDIPKEGTMNIPLKMGEDGKQHYLQVAVTFSVNSKHDDYEAIGATLADRESLLRSEIIAVVQAHTLEEIQASPETVQEEVLQAVQKLLNSTVIYKASFRDLVYA